MAQVIRKNLGLLTLLAVLVGALAALPLRQRLRHSEPLSGDELLREAELGARMPVLIVTQSQTRRFSRAPAQVTEEQYASIALDPVDQARVFIPDKYATTGAGCRTSDPRFQEIESRYGGIWFQGELAHIARITAAVNIPASSKPPGSGEVVFEGSVYRCVPSGLGETTALVASGISMRLPLANIGTGGDAIEIGATTSWAAIPAS